MNKTKTGSNKNTVGCKTKNYSKEEDDAHFKWSESDWKEIEKRVFKLQKRIYKASRHGETKAVRKLQKTLINSWSAKMLAVRKVTQDNQGKKTAGIDGINGLRPTLRLKLVKEMKLNGKAKPLRRVHIPKPKSTETRPLGIPTINDRAKQALAKLALEPEWEAKFEPNSYGFRPGRAAHDAIQQLFLELKICTKYVLDADIAKCFDRINHKELLNKVNTYPKLRHQIKAWLKAGVMDNGCFEETETGTPQGGIISPLLANIALHGMEKEINSVVRTKYGKIAKTYANQPHLVRYADDLVILHKDLEVIIKAKEILENWLKPIGLELKPSKTRICHTLRTTEDEEAGFNFLGFNIRHYETSRLKKLKQCNEGNLTLTIKPNKEAIKRHSDKLKEVVKSKKSAPQAELIKKLNPIIRGWCNYYQTVVSKKTFSKCRTLLWLKLRRWAKRRHPKKSANWAHNKYWHHLPSPKTKGLTREEFATRNDDTGLKLLQHTDTPIKRHVKVEFDRSPFDGDWVYWSTRKGKDPTINPTIAKLLKEQKGICPHCKQNFRTDDLMEIDHIIPKSLGGKETMNNKQLLHRHCHDNKSKADGSNKGRTHDKGYSREKPCAVKVASTVLKTSRRSDTMA